MPLKRVRNGISPFTFRQLGVIETEENGEDKKIEG
jgi:hypothetical protein